MKITEYEALFGDIKILEMENFIARVLPENERAIGGPYIPLEGEADPYNRQIYRIESNLDRLDSLNKSMTHIPLAAPMHGYPVSSHFGPRLDPFKNRAAFHAGIDFGAPTGAPIYAPLPGRIRSARHKGPYGLAIEIDHGNGFRTRYGHLSRVHVREGQRVDFQQHIGDVGNSGRSTGPHLHYEIWYDGRVRDPGPILDSGRQVYNVAKGIGAE